PIKRVVSVVFDITGLLVQEIFHPVVMAINRVVLEFSRKDVFETRTADGRLVRASRVGSEPESREE
ncbi:hypothetical protein PENTCL1PPCAC_8432, partial [Pristionchus entomophagus]